MLPTIILLEDHENIRENRLAIQEIASCLRRQGYTKILLESLDKKNSYSIEFFDLEIKERTEYVQGVLTQTLNLATFKQYQQCDRGEKINILLSHGIPETLARMIVNTPRSIDIYKDCQDFIKLGFQLFGAENETLISQLHQANVSYTTEMQFRDGVISTEILKHHNPELRQGTLIIKVGRLHFSGIREALLRSGKNTNEFAFIELGTPTPTEELRNVRRQTDQLQLQTLKPLLLNLVGSDKEIQHATRSFLSEVTSFNRYENIEESGTGKQTAKLLELLFHIHAATPEAKGAADVLDNKGSDELAMQRQIFIERHFAAKKLQALWKGKKARQKIQPILHQYQTLNQNLVALKRQENEAHLNIIKATEARQYEEVMQFAQSALGFQDAGLEVERNIKTLKLTMEKSTVSTQLSQ